MPSSAWWDFRRASEAPYPAPKRSEGGHQPRHHARPPVPKRSAGPPSRFNLTISPSLRSGTGAKRRAATRASARPPEMRSARCWRSFTGPRFPGNAFGPVLEEFHRAEPGTRRPEEGTRSSPCAEPQTGPGPNLPAGGAGKRSASSGTQTALKLIYPYSTPTRVFEQERNQIKSTQIDSSAPILWALRTLTRLPSLSPGPSDLPRLA
jgi:hypothetical protein